MSKKEVNEKAGGVVKSQIWIAKAWSRQSRKYRTQARDAVVGSVRWTYASEHAERFRAMRSEAMDAARRIATAFEILPEKGARA